MTNRLNYLNLIDCLKQRVPEFKGYDHLIENKIVYFTFFVDFLINNYSNDVIMKESASFVNDMADSEDEELEIILDDFFLNIYSSFKEQDKPPNKFLSKLSPKALNRFNHSVALWLKGNPNDN